MNVIEIYNAGIKPNSRLTMNNYNMRTGVFHYTLPPLKTLIINLRCCNTQLAGSAGQ